MAYNLDKVYHYGTGKIGDVTNPNGQICTYASVSSYTQTTIVWDNRSGRYSNGIYGGFTVGDEILVHVSATNGSNPNTDYLGKYMVATIQKISSITLYVDKDFTQILPAEEFSKYQVQAITIPHFKTLEITTSSITLPQYNVSYGIGGIVTFKCSKELILSGGSINLTNKGINSASYRPKTLQETKGTADTDTYSGWENSITVDQFLLNQGDGACMLWAKKLNILNSESRIGGTTAGKQFKRGNIGGSTLAIVADEIDNFIPDFISTQKGSGVGLGRCYVASNTKLRNDEGLYAYDVISNPLRCLRKLNIRSYGNGELGDIINPTKPLNNFAKVTGISTDGRIIAYTNKTTIGFAPIAEGALVMFHVSKHTDDADMNLLGKFYLTKVLSDDGNNLVLKDSVVNILKSDKKEMPIDNDTESYDAFSSQELNVDKFNAYNCQIISIAQINNLTINNDFYYTPLWDNNKKIGGIYAAAVKGTCNLQNGKIGVQVDKGQAYGSSTYLYDKPYGRNGLAFIGNAQMADILPLGQGNGSVFLLANDVIVNDNTRIGCAHDGALIGGGYHRGGYAGKNNGSLEGGSGAKGGGQGGRNEGGYGGAGVESGARRACQGSHLFIVINRLNKFNMSCFNTGTFVPNGVGDMYSGSGYGTCGWNAGPYGGGGGYNGGGQGNAYTGGGSSGWQFLYINEIDIIDTTGVKC